MGSKKHKKESKKKKHKSRSRSPIDGIIVEKEKKRHKKHKDRKRDRSLDVQEVPVDSHLVPQNGDAHSREETRDRHMRREHAKEKERQEHYEDTEEARPSKNDAEAVATNANADSLSIEETNKLRAKLGLKPLEFAEKPADDGKIKDDLGEFYHKPATNIAQQKKTDKIKEKLQERKEKRRIEQRLQTALLADASDDEDAVAWINKSRDIEKQKKDAAKRAAMLDEMDEVFGVGALVAEEVTEARGSRYSARQLSGLRVAHDVDDITEGRDVVLTLEDKNVLDEDHEDVLMNVNIVDNEKYRKNIEERKKARTGYQAYDDEEDMEAAALGFAKPVLAKYDEEIHKKEMVKDKGFVIGDEDALEAKKFKQNMVREKLLGNVNRRLESLLNCGPQVASDYMSEQEVNAKFKKFKKKGKMRKKPKLEPIDVDNYDPATAPLDTDDTDVKPDHLKTEQLDDEEEEPDSELQQALERARRLRQADLLNTVPKVEHLLEQVKEEAVGESAMVLDQTAEFARALGDIPTYGQAGNRDSNVDIMDFDLEEHLAKPSEEVAAGAWSRVDVNADKPADIASTSRASILEAEPAAGSGVAGALQLALSKGYLDRTAVAHTGTNLPAHLMASHYSIEDKSEEVDRPRGRERYCGPTQEFRDKPLRANVQLQYVDDDGRALCPKEAFRYLSHKFHGKGPGKNKQEKRIKKAVQEGLMKKMSSTDTPLNTLQMLQEKQKETQSPYIVLSGNKRDQSHI